MTYRAQKIWRRAGLAALVLCVAACAQNAPAQTTNNPYGQQQQQPSQPAYPSDNDDSYVPLNYYY